MLSDFRIAFRTLTRSAGFTVMTAAALALGIGSTTAIFSIVNALLLHPVGIRNPERVVSLRARYDKLNLQSIGLSVPDFADAHNNKAVFEKAALLNAADFNYTGGAVPERLQGAEVTYEWFDVFGVKPRFGRVFGPQEDQPSANNVVVLSHAAWMRMFGGDPGALGRTLELNKKPYHIIGIMDADFRWPRIVDIWTPLGLERKAYTAGNRFNENYDAVALLRPGISAPQSNAAVQLIADRVRHDGTRTGQYARDSAWGMFALPFTDYAVGSTKTPTLILLGAVVFVLLIACANIAGLMLARATGRSRDLAVRTALGASRWDLLRQIIAESALLAFAGAAVGIAFAKAAVILLLRLAPQEISEGLTVTLDGHVLGFALLVTALSAALFSFAPAWQISRLHRSDSLKEGGRSGTGSKSRQRLRAALVVSEMALAVVLLAGAGLFLRTLAFLQNVSTGFEPRGVITAMLSIPENQYGTPEKQAQFFRAVTARLAQTPGVSHAAAALPLPFSGSGGSASFSIEGRTEAPGDPGPHGDVREITPEYFSAMKIPVQRGRAFEERDRVGSQPVAIIDDNLARQYWPNADPIGKHLRNGSHDPWKTIVGVVAHVRHSDLAGDQSKGVYYYPMYQEPEPFGWIIARTSGDPGALASAVQAAVRDTDPTQPVHHIKTLQDLVTASLAPRRFVADLMSFFAAVALGLAALGLYGIISYSVTQRTREFGIRMALGARRTNVLMHVIRGGLQLAMLGIAIGTVAAIALGRVLGNQLHGVRAFEPLTLLTTAIVLCAAASLASYIPARRATKIDPMQALRYE